jgi:hypothetical protein
MRRGGRGVDNSFRSKDRLYRRCVNEDIEGDRLLIARIGYNDTSVNWSKYSRPWDVIFDYQGHGIARWLVRELPRGIPENPPPGTKVELHDFAPSHVPLCENYSHSEIWVYRSGVRIRQLSSSLAKKQFRAIMSDRSFILVYPEI